MGPRTHLPRVAECFFIDIAQTHVLHPTGDRVEAGGEGDDIEFVQHTVGVSMPSGLVSTIGLALMSIASTLSLLNCP